jgi:U3 small nucleolar RNA-associated protein 14
VVNYLCEKGWGSWTGEGIEEKPNKPIRQPRTTPHKRDYSETVIRVEQPQPAKYSVTSVPFPYTSAAQYEADLAQPVGKEWNARLAFDALKRPDVIVRSGVYIAPIQYVEPDGGDGKTKKKKKAKQVPGKGQSKNNLGKAPKKRPKNL